MKKILFIFICFYFYYSQLQITLKAKTIEEKDLGCITILKIASEKSKLDGEMVKYEKLKKLLKTYLNKYSQNHFAKKDIKSSNKIHNLKIKEKGTKYINKNLQKCGLK